MNKLNNKNSISCKFGITKKTLSTALLSSVSALCLCTQAMAADLTARLNAKQVGVDDTFQLILSTDDAQGDSPDLSVLQKNFTILGTSQSQQIQIINGNTSQTHSWIVTLSPNKTGQLTIPAIKLGALQSQALSLTVLKDSPVAAKQNDADIRVTAELEDGKYYQFQEIPLTVRIETTADLQRAELIAPRSADVELTQSGQDRQSRQVRNGQAVTVIERQYLLRPQTVGELSLSPFILRGNLVPETSGNGLGNGFGNRFDPFADFERRFGSPFGGMGRSGEPFVAKSAPLTLDVLANPNANGNSAQWFLPAKAVELQAEWQPKNPTFKVGEPVTRIIRLVALGARAEQLPKLSFPAADGVKFYIDNDQTAMRDTAQGTQALREITVSVVPTHGGEVTLPEIAVTWLNTQSNQQETATLPPQIINVVGTPPTATNANATNATNIDNTESTTNKPTENVTTPNVSKKLWWGGMGMALLLLSATWLWRKKGNSQNKTTTPTDNRQHTFNAVKTAVQSGDKSQLYRALLAWKNSGVVFSDKLNANLKQLEQSLFGEKTAQNIELNAIGAEAERLQKQKEQSIEKYNSDRKLPPLYR